jgi:hypothetical protein
MGGQIFGRERVVEIPGIGVIQMWGVLADKPADGAEGYAPSCLFQNIEGTTLDTVAYYNIGTKASANFDPAIMAS